MSDRMYIAARREFLVLLASVVAISAWALFPSTVVSRFHVPLPQASTPSAADVKSAREDVVVASPVSADRLIDAKLLASTPPMNGLVTEWYPSPVVTVSLVPLRSKLQALLMLLYSQSGDDVDPAALEAKLQALLKLPDSVLAQLMEHPDLAALNEMLDAVFLGTSDLSGVKTELDKIDVTSVLGPSEQIDVIKVNGKPAYIVHSSAVQKETDNAAGSPLPLPPSPGEPLTVTMVSRVEEPAGLTASAFSLAPTSEPLTSASAPASQIVSTFTVAPSSEPLSSTPSASPTPSASVEPIDTSQTSQDIMTSGNKFEPGETATQPSGDSSSATETIVPMTTSTGQESPAEAGGATDGGDETSPSNTEGGGASSSSAGETNP